MEVNSYKAKSKTFYSCRIWYYKNKEKHSKFKKGFEKAKEAENWGSETKRKLEGLKAGSDRTTVGEFLDQWIEIKEDNLSPTTLSGYKVNIEHIKRHLRNTRLIEVTLMDIDAMANKLRKGIKKKDEKDYEIKPLKYKSVKYICRTLHAALQYAVRNNMIKNNPCDGVTIKEDDEKFEATVYSVGDLTELLVKLKEQEHELYPSVLLSSMRGLRRGEALGLRWSDINFKAGEACVVNNYIVIGNQKYHRKVKTKKSDRTIDMEGFVADELKIIKERLMKENKRIPVYVCEDENGNLPDPTHISKNIKAFQRANELPECRFHDLRHTFAVLQLESGTDLDTLKRMLGHSKIGITSDMYLHENISLIKKASRKMDKVININCDNSVTKSKDGGAGNL
jgi:integrase